MLPDLPTFKSHLRIALDKGVKARARQMLGAFRDVPVHMVHEGERMETVRADGTADMTEMFTASAEVVVESKETSVLTPERRLEMLDQLAMQMAVQMRTHFLGVLGNKLDEVGQTVDGKGKDPVDAVFEMFSKMQFDFDKDGRPNPLHLDAPPESREKINGAMETIANDPLLSAKFDELMQSKKEDWLAREASRKLVG